MTAAAASTAVLPDPSLALFERVITLAIDHLSAGRKDDAAALLATASLPAAASHAHCDLAGRVLVGAEAYPDALRWFDEALARQPHSAESQASRAAVLTMLARTDDALAAYDAAFRAGCRDPSACFNFGTLLAREGRPQEALAAFDIALQLRPNYPDALRAAGRVLRSLGNTEGALHLFRQGLALAPDDLDVALDCANLLRDGDRLNDALAVYDTALTAVPRSARLWNNRGIVLHDLGRMEEASTSLDTALSLDPGFAEAHHNRGTVLFRQSRFAEAVAASDKALALRPDYPEALSARGLAQKMLGRFDAAMDDFEAALRIDPAFAYARANRGELALLQGRFAEGWPDYEYRFFTDRQTKKALKAPVPEWRGEAAPAARVAVFGDQGSGDCLQFARFLPDLAARVGAVTFICPPRLHRVLRAVTARLQVCTAVDDAEPFDFQLTLSSMPTAFRTDFRTLARSRPYLAAEPALVARWAERIGPSGFRVGLCWRGGQTWQCDPNRSVPFAALAPLAGCRPDLRLFSLQMPDNAAGGGAEIEDLSGELDAGPDGFIDTAAVMANLDLVITCDTSIAHLAGALGRPVWVLLQAVPEWRWLLGRDTSPWYSSTRLFRQTTAGRWDEPVAAAVDALRAGAARAGASVPTRANPADLSA